MKVWPRVFVLAALLLARTPVFRVLDVLQQLLADTKEQLSALPTAHPQRYAVLLQGLIKQGAKALGEKDVSVICRRDDLAIVKAALAALSKDADLADLTLSVKETAFLPATWCAASHVVKFVTYCGLHECICCGGARALCGFA